MGQKFSTASVKGLTRMIGNAVDDVDARPPPVSQPEGEQAEQWDKIYNAAGFAKLLRAVKDFLGALPAHDLFQCIANHHDEPLTETKSRFALRYVNDRNWDKMILALRACLIARMVKDEIDLPGFRLAKAMERWKEIFQALDEDDVDGRYEQARKLTELIKDVGFLQFFRCYKETCSMDEDFETVVQEVWKRDPVSGEETVYMPRHASHMNAGWICEYIADVNEEFTIMANGNKVASFNRWERKDRRKYLSGPPPATATASFQAIAVGSEPLRWRRVYLLLLRHVRSLGADDATKRVLGELEEEERRDLAKDGEAAFVAPGRRRPSDVKRAIHLADILVTQERNLRGIQVPRTLRADYGDGLGGGESSTVLNLRLAKLRKTNDENERIISVLNTRVDRLSESTKERNSVVNSLSGQIKGFKKQLAIEDNHKRPRHCGICFEHLRDYDEEQSHMLVHFKECNRARASAGVGPYDLQGRRLSRSCYCERESTVSPPSSSPRGSDDDGDGSPGPSPPRSDDGSLGSSPSSQGRKRKSSASPLSDDRDGSPGKVAKRDSSAEASGSSFGRQGVVQADIEPDSPPKSRSLGTIGRRPKRRTESRRLLRIQPAREAKSP